MTLIERGYPFAFYPITTNPRIGQSKVHWSHGTQTLYLVLRMVMLFAPLRIFVPTGAMLMVAGGGWGSFTALSYGRGFSTLGAVTLLLGFLIMALGLIVDQISQTRLSQLSRLSRRLANEEPIV